MVIHSYSTKEVKTLTVALKEKLSLCLNVEKATAKVTQIEEKLKVCYSMNWIPKAVWDHFEYPHTHDFKETKKLMEKRENKKAKARDAEISQLQMKIDALESELAVIKNDPTVKKALAVVPQG